MKETQSRPSQIYHRLDWWRQPGLLLTVLSGVVLPGALFGFLARAVSGKLGGIAWDLPILRAAHHTVQPGLNNLAIALAHLGVYWGVVPTVGAIILGLLVARYWRSLLYVVLTSGGAALLNRVTKTLIHRIRPDLWTSPYAHPTSFSFPSGHAMASLTLALIVIRLTWNTRWRWISVALGSLFTGAVGWSRVYLGVHYPSDVLAGWLLAIAWATAIGLLVQPDFPTGPHALLKDDRAKCPEGNRKDVIDHA